MLKHVLKRLISLLPVLLILSIVVFSIVYLTPGDPAASILGMEATPDEIAALSEKMGLNRPIHEQYLKWLGGVLHGDLGTSYFMQEDVRTAIFDRLRPTLALAVFSEFLTILIGIPLGIFSAFHHERWPDRLISVINLFGMALPSFVISILLMLVFAVILKIFPVAGYVSFSGDLMTYLKFLVLPGVALAIGHSAYLIRVTRSAILEELGQTYVKTAMSRGMTDVQILIREVLKNALLPIITVIGQSFGSLVAGAIIVETIFNIPGLGQLLINSLARRDLMMIQGIVLLTSVLYVVINLLTDLLYLMIDPRIELED